MSRTRPLVIMFAAVAAITTAAACSSPSAPVVERAIDGPRFNTDSTTDSTLTGYNPGHGK